MNDRVQNVLYSVACVAALVLAISAVALVAVQGRNDARVALRTTAAVCSLRRYYVGQVASSEAYLAMTPAERQRKYGTSLGDIPDVVIREGLVKEEQVVAALRPIQCVG